MQQTGSNTALADQQIQADQAQNDQLALAVVDSAHLTPNKDDDDEDIADELSKNPPSVIVATKLLIGSWVCSS